MGKYHEYAKRLDTLARESFAAYEKASDELKKAEQAKRDHPMPKSNFAPKELWLDAKEAEVDYERALDDYHKAQRAYQNTLKESQVIRTELLEAVTADMAVKPEDLDRNVVDLLNSGICSASEIADLYGKAENATTKRFIAKHAKDLVADDPKMDVRHRQTLNSVIADSRGLTIPEHSQTMLMFDAVNDVLRRCVNNPTMISHWGEYADQILSDL